MPHHIWSSKEIAILEEALLAKKEPADIKRDDLPQIPKSSIVNRLNRLKNQYSNSSSASEQSTLKCGTGHGSSQQGKY